MASCTCTETSTLSLALSVTSYILVLTCVDSRVTARTSLSSTINGAANTTVTFTREPSLHFQVSGAFNDSDTSVGPSAGDTVRYALSLENNGTVTVWGATITSRMDGVVVCVPPLESLQLAPTDKTECTMIYEVGYIFLWHCLPACAV